LQLAHIPRPVSTGEQVDDRGIEAAQALVVAFRSQFEESSGQKRYIFASFKRMR
jgi:hypothetical protein